jgi:transposase
MNKITNFYQNKTIFIGLDLHKKTWNLTARCEGMLIKYWTMPASKEKLVTSLSTLFPGASFVLAYEAGCFGYWIYDYLVDHGIKTIITPPNLIPKEDTQRVKTDRIDSRKLANYLEKGLLKAVAVPEERIRLHRAVIRTRRQISKDQKRIQNQIRSSLLFHGIECDLPLGRWANYLIDNLYCLKFRDPYFEESFHRMLDRLVQVRQDLSGQTLLIKKIARLPEYEKQIDLLLTIPGVGLITAIEILMELYDIKRFQTGDQVASYIGLTPKEHSTGETVKSRRGHITHAGNAYLRSLFVELAWRAIRKDVALSERFTRIHKKRGKKIAIVALARTLAVRVRHILVSNNEYVLGVVQ